MKKNFTCHSGPDLSCKIRSKLPDSFYLLLSLCIILLGAPVFAQQQNTVRGTVLDEKGAPLPGVSIKVKGTGLGTVTSASGKFTINADKGTVLVFSFVSYASQAYTVNSQQQVQIKLIPVSSNLNEVVVIGYGTQKKATLTGAVSSVNNAEIITTKNENLENSLTGKLPGLRIVQNSSEPGDFNNSIDIRGFGSPLVVIDGIPRDNITRLDQNDIESISVLKDASAAVYGVRGANGVILITTKKGKKGALELTYSGTYGEQVPYGLPKPVGAVDYMTLSNELSAHNVNGGHVSFTPADIDAFKKGTKTSTNWYDAVIKRSAAQVQHNLSASGGNENTSYFISLGFTGQDGIFKSNDLNYKKYNVRSNLTTRITRNLTFELNLNGIMDEKDQPGQDAWYIIRSFWRQVPTQSIYANNNPAYLNNGQVDGSNPVAMSNSSVDGYKTFNNKWFQSSASLTYKIPKLSGLSLKGLYSYDYQLSNNKIYSQQYNQYSFDGSTGLYNAIVNQSPGTVLRQFYEYPSNLSQLSLNYAHTFKGANNITALLLYEQSNKSADNFYAQRELSLPVDQLLAGNSTNQVGSMDGNGSSDFYRQRNTAIVGRLNYDYKSRYLAEFSFRDDGSSQFGPGRQWGFFPAASVGWRISEEKFWKDNSILSIVNNLKFRASYGKVGDDGSAAYQYISGYYYPAQGGGNNTLPPGSVFNGTFVNGVSSKGLPNPNITWYTSRTFDMGLDAEVKNGLAGVTFDYFRRNRTGLLATELLSLPDVVGADLPQENLNGDRAQGFDFELNHHNHFGRFTYNAKATFSYVNTQNTNVVQARAGNSYLNWLSNSSNRNNNAYWGYGADGRYTNYNSILNSPVYVGRSTVVGDYRYQDWNGDGQADGNDLHPVARTGTPMETFGLALNGAYDGFDFSLLFQGTGKVDVSYFEQLNTPLWGGGSALSQFLDRYHPLDPAANPYDPKTVWVPGNFAYTGTVPDQSSLFNIQSAAYVRLKSAELGYTFPNQWLSAVGIKSARIYANGYNLLTLTKLKYLDPEHPSSTYGYLYPLDKIFSLGLIVKF